MTNPQSPDDLAAVLLPQLARLSRTLARSTARLSRTQIAVLVTLRDDGPTRISDLAARERVAQPSMTALIDRLERRGLVARRADPTDRRAVPVAITRKGARELAGVVAEVEGVLARRLSGLSAGERAALASALPALTTLTTQELEEQK